MYFAIPSYKGDYSIQIDVKVCFRPEIFDWRHFGLNYASNNEMMGGMIKPLGLTMDPEGLHIRVKEIEETNFAGSMVFVSKNTEDMLKIVCLDRRMLNGGFKSMDESIYVSRNRQTRLSWPSLFLSSLVYEYLASS